jgi:tetratricopeptide (TPR) repeat protein
MKIVIRLTVLIALGVTLGACTANMHRAHQRNLEELIHSRGVDPRQLVYPDQLSKEMREWLHERFPRRRRSEYAAYALLEALEGPNGLDLEYEAGFTGTASEVFETHKYNCLSFSHLFLAMAREIEVDAHYFSVDRIQRFRRSGDMVLVSGHVTVGFGIGLDRQILEYKVGPEVNYKTATPISDITALALFYSNRGAELIQQEQYEEAIEWLEISTKLDPELPGGWVNLGVARRRSGDLDLAEAHYLKSLELDDAFFPAYRNLASLYQLRGEGEVAAELFAVLDQRGNRNPFAFIALGDHSLAAGRTDEAEAYYRRALRLSNDRAEAEAALGDLALEKGMIREAREWLEKARESDPESGRVEELERRLAPLEETLDPETTPEPVSSADESA